MTEKKKRVVRPMAKTRDKYQCYQDAVQEPESDVKFFQRLHRKEFDRPPRQLREDFCGTAWMSCVWVQAHRQNIALGVDLDPEPLSWGIEHNARKLSEEQLQRLTLVGGNALEVREPKVDVVAALNFSYFVFKTKAELRGYFQAAYRNLGDEGLFVADIEGGTETMEQREETRKEKRFTYVWDQDYFDAITHETLCYISFRFPDGSQMKRAFCYDWRLWTIPEVREVMLEVGFSRADVYWEGTDKEGEGNGIFKKRERAENCESWIAYVVGVKR